MTDIRGTLGEYAHDAELQIASCGDGRLVLGVCLPSRGNERWELRIDSLIHLDMNPCINLGRVEFGGLDLLPQGYMATRNFDYGGEISQYRVLKIADEDERQHFVVYYGDEQIVRDAIG